MGYINNIVDLKECIKIEKKIYFGNHPKTLQRMILRDHDYQIWEYQMTLRYLEYHYNSGHRLRTWYWSRRHSVLGARLGIHIPQNTFDVGLHIWHYGSIIVNGYARIGKNCNLHGCNCIGNKGYSSKDAPLIGNNVDLGVGAVVIGKVSIADNVKIGANAVVLKSCNNSGTVLAGNPAKEIVKVNQMNISVDNSND